VRSCCESIREHDLDHGAEAMDVMIRAFLSGIAKDAFAGRRARTAIVLSAVIVGVLAIVVFWGISSRRSRPPAVKFAPLAKTDHQGDRWTLELTSGQPLASIQQSSKAPGEPLLVRTDLYKSRTGGYSIGLSVQGRAGERYSGAVSKNGQRLPPPRFEVVDRQGRLLGAGTFEYG